MAAPKTSGRVDSNWPSGVHRSSRGQGCRIETYPPAQARLVAARKAVLWLVDRADAALISGGATGSGERRRQVPACSESCQRHQSSLPCSSQRLILACSDPLAGEADRFGRAIGGIRLCGVTSAVRPRLLLGLLNRPLNSSQICGAEFRNAAARCALSLPISSLRVSPSG